MDTPELYVVGGMYKVKGADKHRFSLVKPSNTDRPYMARNFSDALTLHTHTKHHAYLYRVTYVDLNKRIVRLRMHGYARETEFAGVPVVTDIIVSEQEAEYIIKELQDGKV